MSDQASATPRQAEARIAGLAYLATIASGMFAEVVVRDGLRVSGDAAATAANLLASEPLFRLAILSDLAMLSSYLAVTALLYRLFLAGGRALSLCAALFSLAGIALLAANTGLLSAPLLLLGDAAYLEPFAPAEREVLAYTALRMHGHIYGFSGAFFGLYCASIGVLALRSRAIPRVVAGLMLAAGLTFLIDTTLDLAAPSLARRVPDIVLSISLLGEGALAIWLTLFGARGQVSHAQRT